jgi:DNA-directed RNA polymerase specialized sigma24 family protein
LSQSRKDIVAWVGSHVLPHEAAVRAWLRRWTSRYQDIDDIIQEAYCRLAAMNDVTHVSNGRAYMFQTTRNIVLEQVRRSKIVRIDNVTDMSSLSIVDEAPPLDRVVAAQVPANIRPATHPRRLAARNRPNARRHSSRRRKAGDARIAIDHEGIGRR